MLFNLAVAKKLALIVGVAENVGIKLKALHSDVDLANMKRFLESHNFEVKILQNKRATLLNVRKEFKKATKGLRSDDLFLFYYTGHGDTMEGINKNEAEDNFLALYSMQLNGREVVAGVLSDNEISFWMNKIVAKKILFVDACHSGTIYKSLGDVNGFKRGSRLKKFKSYSPSNYISISSSQDDQTSIDTQDGGVFTTSFLKLFDKNRSIKSLMSKVTNDILKNRRQKANLYTSSKNLQNMTFGELFGYKPNLYFKLDTMTGKRNYQNGETIGFVVKTKMKSGILYLYSGDELLDKMDIKDCPKYQGVKGCQFKDILTASSPLTDNKIKAVLRKNGDAKDIKIISKQKIIAQMRINIRG